jgi:uncharacterized secreted repeat protein (TIGR03808 family)
MPHLSRRSFAAGLAALPLLPLVPARAFGNEPLSLVDGIDQTAAIQRAVDAAGSGVVQLPAGRFFVEGLSLRPGTRLLGHAGRTQLVGGTVLSLNGTHGVLISGLTLEGRAPVGDTPLISAVEATNLDIEASMLHTGGVGIDAYRSGGTISACRFYDFGDAALHSLDSNGFGITDCEIARCGNAGLRIWGSAPRHDGSMLRGNRIQDIAWEDGGNGQNGNGINIFRADGVVVADNQFDNCAFTAVRLNTTSNTLVRGNVCRDSGEVAIFSEFAFSGSVIADNLIDGAAAGISMTNLDSGGHLASCTGNIVRNIAPRSEVNPDVVPYGIAAEADAVISGNIVDTVPGIGIAAGYGPFLRNVVISSNVVRHTRIGIGVSIAEGAGAVHIADNLVAAAETPIAGLAWDRIVEPDLTVKSNAFPNVTASNNRIVAE